MTTADEDDLLRSVAIQNAQSILAARQRAEREILQAKEELERKTRELAHSLAMMRATLDSTWDGIMVTDETGRVTGFNQKLVEMWHIPTERLERRFEPLRRAQSRRLHLPQGSFRRQELHTISWI